MMNLGRPRFVAGRELAGRLDISYGHHPKMKARAELCQKVIEYIL